MQAILTKYLSPTDSKPSRYKASAEAGSIAVAADYSKSADENHEHACFMLVQKMGWTEDQGKGYRGHWVMGWLPSGDACHVFVPASE